MGEIERMILCVNSDENLLTLDCPVAISWPRSPPQTHKKNYGNVYNVYYYNNVFLKVYLIISIKHLSFN